MTRLVLALVTAMTVCISATQDPPQTPAKDLAALEAAAEQGSAKAQLDYAKAVESREEGRAWARKAADQGLAEAWFWLGYMAPGAEALPYYEKAAEMGYPEAFGYALDGLLSELDMSGTARAAIALEEEGRLRDEFLDAVRGFEAGRLPVETSFKEADAELNAVYARIMKQEDLEQGTVDKAGIRDTQREWLAYRDAWATFGRSRYPRVSEAAWKAWTTTARVTQLEELVP